MVICNGTRQVALGVHHGGHCTTSWITRDAREDNMCFGLCNSLAQVGLQEAGGTQESGRAVGHIEGWDLEDSKHAFIIMHSPGNMSLSFNAKTFGNALQLGGNSGLVQGANKVRSRRGDREACTRVPDNSVLGGLGETQAEHGRGLECSTEGSRFNLGSNICLELQVLGHLHTSTGMRLSETRGAKIMIVVAWYRLVG